MATKIHPCPKCDSENVFVSPIFGGRGTGETTAYDANCTNCGYTLTNLPGSCSGRRRDAIAEWNREAKTMRKLCAQGAKIPSA